MESTSSKYVSLAINCSCFSFSPLRDLLMCEDMPIWCPVSSHILSNCSQLTTSLTQMQCSPHLEGGPWEEARAGPGSGLEVPESQKWSIIREHELWVTTTTSTWTCGLLALWRAMQSSQIQALKAQISVLSVKVAGDSWKQAIYPSPDTFFSFGIELSFLAGK